MFGTPGCGFWNFDAGAGTGKTIFGRRKVGRASAVCEADLSDEFLFLIFESTAPLVVSLSCLTPFDSGVGRTVSLCSALAGASHFLCAALQASLNVAGSVTFALRDLVLFQIHH